MKNLIKRLGGAVVFAILSAGAFAQTEATPLPQLVRHENGQYVFYVDGHPFTILGGQSGNSNNWPAMHQNLFKVMEDMPQLDRSGDVI